MRVRMLWIAALTAGAILAGAEGPVFEVATVKPWTPTGGPFSINLGFERRGKVSLTNVNMLECIRYAYDVAAESQIVGPYWLHSSELRYVIVGQAPPETKNEDLLRMTQALLVERFHLILHKDKKPLPYFALVVAKAGPNLAPPKTGDYGVRLIAGHFDHGRMTLPMLGTLLSRVELARPVLDMTGLAGPFAIKLDWMPERRQGLPRPEGAAAAPQTDAATSLYTALQEQLGLKLEARKGPVEVLVVDHAEKVPAEN